MESYEKNSSEEYSKSGKLPEKLDYSMVKFFWQVNPLVGKSQDSIPKFLRNIDVLKNFSENELRILTNSMHRRSFANKEVIFRQGDAGIGFYFIYGGYVDVIVENESSTNPGEQETQESRYVLSLEKFDYFGELALLQNNSVRNATVTAREHCEVLGLFKPDIETLIETHPVVATKLLQAISLIISNRLFSLTKTVRELKYKLAQYEKTND